MNKKPLKIGFDLDGVLLYNPARVVRPLISLMKKKKLGIDRKELEFYVPQPGLGQFLWEMLHKSSVFLAPGFEQIIQLKAQGYIEPYLITGRFGHLQQDYFKWKKKMRADELFFGCYMNDKDEQPHLFKERIIKELDLDVFIEDNWDIVKYLAKNCVSKRDKNKKTRVIWVSNVLDFRINYHSKATSLKKALALIDLPIKYS